ncbi:translation protein SH3-like domain-containing protein [Alternaria rosae]|uniref:translation protein SH3-like domain-containing protein n=1 Tax=Alternaria rosae TaxID=1187941 RepID=UPI001E8CFFCB|nr:translation protein SH3-like domain-containing protein [Alternaria rosae]KAH6882332.1 translation protein SH3-like domain-containing protein [Alternaria rosae]
MSAVIPCTRATAQRVAFRAVRCRRFASTETVAVDAAPTTPILPARREQRLSTREPDLSQRLHRALYPHLYGEDGQFTRGELVRMKRRKQKKPIDSKWQSVMKQKSVDAQLSHQFGVPVFKPTTLNIKKTCPNPISAVNASQISLLDPTGARTRLFAKDNPECARVGDILLVRQRTGDPFAGVCINIRRRGTDTAILLRGQLTRVGVEMWYKVYSPLVEGIEVVQRAAKRARRARLTYMRTVKHDRGSVENVVRMYLRQKAALGTAEGQKKKGAGAAAAMMGGKKKGRGKKR